MDSLAVRGKLKLKKPAGGKVEKKKQKSKNISKEKTEAMLAAGEKDDDEPTTASGSPPPPTQQHRVKTKAELAFEKRQAQLQAERVHKKAQISHRDRVEKFNKYLETLPETNDIPKVSWTK